MFPAFSLQKTCVNVSNSLFPLRFTFPSYVIWLTATCHPGEPPEEVTCTAQLSVSVPFNWLNDTPAESPRVPVSALTEPESLGHPVPEKTSLVMRGATGGAAKVRAGRTRKKSEDRILTVLKWNLVQQVSYIESLN